MDEAGIRNVLDQIGEPADIAAEARARFGVQPRGMGTQEIVAVLMLSAGSLLIPLIGWLIGLALLWGSAAWTQRDKWVGTLLFPGGMLAALLLVGGGIGSYGCYGDGVTEVCEGKPSDLMVGVYLLITALSLLGPIFSAIHLSRRARRSANTPAY